MRAYALMEIMIGVAILSIGLVTIMYSMSAAMTIEGDRVLDQRLTRILDNYYQEVLLLPTLPQDGETYPYEDDFGTMEISQIVEPVELENEEGEAITGIHRVQLTVTPDNGTYAKSIAFYIYR